MKAKTLLCTILCSTLLLISYFALTQQSTTSLIVYAAGTPDQYGNRILMILAEEWNSTSNRYQFPYGQCKHVCTYDGSNTFDGETLVNVQGAIFHSYTNGFELRVYDNHPLRLMVKVAANKTLISNPSTGARVFLNISGVVTNAQMTYYAYMEATHFYILQYSYVWNATGQPNAGATYNVALKYEIYY